MNQKRNKNENKKYIEANKNGNKIYQNSRQQVSSLRKKVYNYKDIYQKEKPQINNLILHIKKLEREELSPEFA